MRKVHALRDEIQAAGAWVFSGGPARPSTRHRGAREGRRRRHTDGPYIEGKEHIGGFTVIKAPDLDAALEWGRNRRRPRDGLPSKCGRSWTQH
jgi:hypothetical protein